MNRLLRVFGILMSFFLLLLFIAHLRYPFLTPASTGWSIGIVKTKDPLQELKLDSAIIFNKEWLDSLTPGKTRFLADPFLFYEKGEYFLFFEHQGEGNANIALFHSLDGKKYRYRGEVLNESFHLSFPYVFKHKNEYYMLPETKQAENVLLYKAEDFPFEWKIADTLIKGRKYKDPVLLISDSLNLLSVSDDNLTQYIYTSDSLKGNWRLHPGFRIRRGDETRGGGNFFQYEGEIYIPLQNNQNGYGTGISLYNLRQSGDNIWLEQHTNLFLKKVKGIKWFNRGMHHLSLNEINGKFYLVVDGDKKSVEDKYIWSWKASLKYNYYDLMKLLPFTN